MTKKTDNPRFGFIIVDYKPRQHLTYESAAEERKRLQETRPDVQFKIMRVLNASSADIHAYNSISAMLEQAATEDAARESEAAA